MSTVEDVRQVIQDFLAPELRAMTARFDAIDIRLNALEKVMEARFKEVDTRFKEADLRIDSRFNEVVLRIRTIQDTVDRNDSAQKLLIAKLTQDFEFDKRLTEIEREIRSSKTTAA